MDSFARTNFPPFDDVFAGAQVVASDDEAGDGASSGRESPGGTLDASMLLLAALGRVHIATPVSTPPEWGGISVGVGCADAGPGDSGLGVAPLAALASPPRSPLRCVGARGARGGGGSTPANDGGDVWYDGSVAPRAAATAPAANGAHGSPGAASPPRGAATALLACAAGASPDALLSTAPRPRRRDVWMLSPPAVSPFSALPQHLGATPGAPRTPLPAGADITPGAGAADLSAIDDASSDDGSDAAWSGGAAPQRAPAARDAHDGPAASAPVAAESALPSPTPAITPAAAGADASGGAAPARVPGAAGAAASPPSLRRASHADEALAALARSLAAIAAAAAVAPVRAGGAPASAVVVASGGDNDCEASLTRRRRRATRAASGDTSVVRNISGELTRASASLREDDRDVSLTEPRAATPAVDMVGGDAP